MKLFSRCLQFGVTFSISALFYRVNWVIFMIFWSVVTCYCLARLSYSLTAVFVHTNYEDFTCDAKEYNEAMQTCIAFTVIVLAISVPALLWGCPGIPEGILSLE